MKLLLFNLWRLFGGSDNFNRHGTVNSVCNRIEYVGGICPMLHDNPGSSRSVTRPLNGLDYNFVTLRGQNEKQAETSLNDDAKSYLEEYGPWFALFEAYCDGKDFNFLKRVLEETPADERDAALSHAVSGLRLTDSDENDRRQKYYIKNELKILGLGVDTFNAAALTGRTGLLQLLMRGGGYDDIGLGHLAQPLLAAAHNFHAETVGMLLSSGADSNQEYPWMFHRVPLLVHLVESTDRDKELTNYDKSSVDFTAPGMITGECEALTQYERRLATISMIMTRKPPREETIIMAIEEVAKQCDVCVLEILLTYSAPKSIVTPQALKNAELSRCSGGFVELLYRSGRVQERSPTGAIELPLALRVGKQRYKLIQPLDTHSSLEAAVFQGQDRRSGEYLAIKVMPDMRREITHLTKFACSNQNLENCAVPRIINYFPVSATEHWLVTNRIDGNLEKFIRLHADDIYYSTAGRLDIAKQIVRSFLPLFQQIRKNGQVLGYFSSSTITFRELAENEFEFQIASLDSLQSVGDRLKAGLPVNIVRTFPPEVFINRRYSKSSDMWALGLFLAEFVSDSELLVDTNGEMPRSINALFKRWLEYLGPMPAGMAVYMENYPAGIVEKRPITALLPTEEDPAFVDFVKQCLKYETASRMTPDQAMKHKWLADE